MPDKIDLEYYVSEISDPSLGIFFAIEDDEPVKRINEDLDSVQEALDNYGKVFIEIGYFSYNDEYETRLMFDGDEFIIGLTDRYYDKYKFSLAGYGIFLDSDLNVECGYYTTEAPPSGHGPGDTTIHDFKDAEKDDVVKEHIYSLLSWTGIENSQTSHDENNHMGYTDSETNIEILQNKLKSLKAMITSITKLNKVETDIPQDKREKFEDTIIDLVETAENLLTDIKNNLYHGSYFAHELNNVYKIEKEINKIEKETIPKIKQNFCGDLFKKIYLEIDKDYYSSLCEKISDFFSLNFKSNDEILKYLCNNFPENSVYLFILHYEPNALPDITFDKGLHKRGLLIRLKNGSVLSNWRDVSKKDNVEYVIEDLSNKRKLSGKYESLRNLKSIKLTGINKNVTDMSSMFSGCVSLVDISGLSELDVSNVTHMDHMFSYCCSLVDVFALSEWDVSNVNTMLGMFLDCDSLVDLSGLSKWDVSTVGNMQAMFMHCSSLMDVSGLSEWDVSSVGNMFNLFRDCSSLVDVSALGNWDVSSVGDMTLMFSGCTSLVDVSALGNWDVSYSDVGSMFSGCTSLVDVSALGEWGMSNVSFISNMFSGCTSLVDVSALGKWNTSNVIWIEGMFSRCKSLVSISGLSKWDMSNVTQMSGMFSGCESLVDVSALGKWNTPNVKWISGMFSGCESLVDVSALGKWDVSNVSEMQEMFRNCTSLVDISGLSEWDISNVENMEKMFGDCNSLEDDSLLKHWTDIMINKIENKTIPKIKQSFCSELFKKLHGEIDKDYYSSLCKKIADFFLLNYKTDDEILKYLCNNFPENSVYLFILHYEPNALPDITFDKGLHKGGLIIRLKNGAILSSWNDLVKKSNVEYVIEDLSNETNLSGKYKSCTNLKSVKLTGINKEVTDMSKMFYSCDSLEDVSGLSNLDVSNVTIMEYMFAYCKSLVDVSALSKWDVSNVRNMEVMFMSCKSLVNVSGLSKWDVSNVRTMWGMFMHCNSLVNVSGLSKWDVSNVKNMEYMFKDCNSLVDDSLLKYWSKKID